jgi:hypothetical protein
MTVRSMIGVVKMVVKMLLLREVVVVGEGGWDSGKNSSSTRYREAIRGEQRMDALSMKWSKSKLAISSDLNNATMTPEEILPWNN